MKIKIKASNQGDIAKDSTLGRCKTVQRSVSELMPAKYNPRTIGDRERQGLSNSINKFGLVQPIIVNTNTGNIVGGHQRLKALIEEGATTTDVVEVHLSIDEEKALNLTLNNTNIQGEFIASDLEAMLDSIDNKELLSGLNILSDIDWEVDLNTEEEEETKVSEGLSRQNIVILIPSDNAYIKDELISEIELCIDERFNAYKGVVKIWG